MRLKQKLVATLAGMLILLQGFPAFAVSEESMLESEITTIERDSPVSSDDQINPPDALPAQGDSLTQDPTVPPDVDGAAEPPSIRARPYFAGGQHTCIHR